MANHRKLITLTNLIIFFTIILYIVKTYFINWNLIFGLNMLFFQEKLYFQPLSSLFTHANIEHLIMNMLVLWQFGNMLETYIGKLKFFFLYFIGGILTSICTLGYIYYISDIGNVVGASGAISVLFGYIAYKDIAQRYGLILLILLISFVPLLFGYHIAWYSHLFGFAIGYIYSYIK